MSTLWRGKMKGFNNGVKVGIIMEIISGVTMAILVIMGKMIPNVVAWIFMIGLIITIVSSLYSLKQR